MQQIQINNKYLEFQNGIISYHSPTVEKVIEEGDALQALSIRYHCPIAELKRLNNIHRENEIFAKKSIKVPARQFTAALVSIHTSGSNSPKDTSGKEIIDPEVIKLKLDHRKLRAIKDKV